MMAKIVLIEDDEGIRTVLRLALRRAGYHPILESDRGDDGLELILREKPDLVLLDLMLPGLDGLSVCRLIREKPAVADTPIIILSAKSTEADIVRGLEMGADDYVTKPFSKPILLARIEATLRRKTAHTSLVQQYDGLVLNQSERTATYENHPLTLTRSEFDVLWLFCSHVGRVWTRERIISAVQGDDKGVTARTVDTLLVGVRRKLGTWATHIETVRGIGYRMNP